MKSIAAIDKSRLGNLAVMLALAVVAAWLFRLHAEAMQWRDPGLGRWLAAGLSVSIWMGFVALLRRRRAQASGMNLSVIKETEASAILVAYASQTGYAEQLARQTAQGLMAAKLPVRLAELGGLDVPALRAAGRVLFVVSTTGEGDAPDRAASFEQRCLRQAGELDGLSYGLLALGDRDYENFCGFGHRLHHWLAQSGAQPLFDPVEVDNSDDGSLRHWQHHLGLLSGANDLPDWQPPQYQRWQLIERHLLNPGSAGGACFHLALRPLDGELAWEAGDLVEIEPRHAMSDVTRWLDAAGFDGSISLADDGGRESLATRLSRSHLPLAADVAGWTMEQLASILRPLPHREYSIASLPTDGALHLLVRRMHRDDGTPGIGSGWLTQGAPEGSEIALRIRSNPGFHRPVRDVPLILIGTGTGLAGLRALLKARVAAGHRRHWLLFGERHAAHDFFHREDIERWQAAGDIERLDLAWSREAAAPVYVQQRLAEAADELRRWVEQGAAIYVCGSLAGMAPGVDAVLRATLGGEQIEQLRMSGRYRRDVY
ncbi:sulfite reductase (NADPH) flavoprotein alpha-component [Dyella sp. OK004]|uniref:sulfite reductase subunit alpha n=1 Tax=Dyella sp. OK004 TaxID=1855292 RepID=UPI0008E7D867|nr:sulfite reductase flavoprotein subunit alpha [Dyella sp. OK004]SFS05013.1 sulfite reductase (NADPH) flavoprotein alpha-component [Dyella sp. OK004]